jgi:hypothetical protein
MISWHGGRRLLPLAAVLILSVAVVARAQIHLERFDHQLGPFEIGDQRFTVMLHKKRAAGGTDGTAPDTQQTLARVEIRDAAGALHYQRTLPFQLSGAEFQYTVDASAEILQGPHSRGLLLSYGIFPAPPLSGQSWQVLGLFNGKLVPFSKPVSFDGELKLEKTANGIAKTGSEPGFRPEIIRAKIWSGNFFVMVPLRIDWLSAKMSPAWRCNKLTAKGRRALCEYEVEADRVPSDRSLTFVRLFPEADEAFTPVHVVVSEDSKVELLAAEAEIIWSEDADEANLKVGKGPWLKVRIDNKEGWMHSEEDFEAIGLPEMD